MLPPPSYPFWPLSPTRPKRILGTLFQAKELQSLDAFERALASKGFDYKSIQLNQPASLLLELNNAVEHRLLRKVVNDWGPVYSLWKASEHYIDSRGTQRVQMRKLLKYLFFWGSRSPGRSSWPSRLAVGLTLFRRENGLTGVRARLLRSERLTARLTPALVKLARELRVSADRGKIIYREGLLTVARECENVLQEAGQFRSRSHPSQRMRRDDEWIREESRQAEKLIVGLVNAMERALIYLDHAAGHLGPLDAHRARHIMRPSVALLLEIHPDAKPEHPYSPAAVMLFDAFVYTGRIFVGFWLLPLVLVTPARPRRGAGVPARA